MDANTVRHGVEGLMYLMIESSKLMVCVSYYSLVLVLN